VSTDETRGFQRQKANYKTTRRGLIAAAAIFGAMAYTRTAHAFGRPPLDNRRRPPGGSGGHCVLRGTRVLTPHGEVKVEDLAIGDLVTTIDGTAKPIKWIGFRRHDRSSTDDQPIKIARSALGHLVPHADLFVSPQHAVYIDGILVPARNLVNGRSIVPCTSLASVEYFHIELQGHDVIFTEGAPTETLLAGREREFDNWSGNIDPVGNDAELASFAPRVPANHSAVLRSRLRSAVSPLIDVRQPGDAIWERLAERAETQIAA
jgi:hypothetical protein